MTFTERTTRCLGIIALVLVSWSTLAQAAPEPDFLLPRQLTQTLCSSQNTASMSANLSIWQTNGLCQDFCTAKNYAFAIVQWQSCWCSDVAPAASTEAEVSDKCNDICPGYDIEHCGSRPNYYGYLALAKNPTSTAGSGGDSTSSQAPSTTADVQTSTSSRPRTTVQTVTADGTVRTVTVTPTATGTDGATGASELSPSSQSSSNGPSTGTVVGIVVGVIGAVVALAGLGLFLFFRRRKQRQNENDKYDEPSHRGSSAGMTGSPRNPEMVVNVDGGRWDPDATSEQRRSRLLAHDPRLDPLPRGLYVRNKSAESINTLRDDQDYSRKVHQPVLRATNPDPE
ncbi:cell wall integrity and stress response component 4 [Colletotrichum spaethianum]|uniref:Cell wall integrity and stress response component 4 n=1 Tax=Colletotrichum spaethianum TaxID=700344 RepID=A0AA37LFP6_9PEZI|nr:cell wall integrity and stress response component 4 [Colletotrichum spaethianum]GKT45720.1 cell wall integrity and stress response component 4 [Colletotrichum spaethianum]